MIPHFVIKLALRYLRTKWVVYVSVLAVAVATGGVIFVMAVQNWLVNYNRASLRGTMSDIVVRTDDFRGFEGYRELREQILKIDGVECCAATLEIKAVASSQSGSGAMAPCVVMGVELDQLQKVGPVRSYTEPLGRTNEKGPATWPDIEKEFAQPGQAAPALVGEVLAEKLNPYGNPGFSCWTPTSFADGNDKRMVAVGVMKSRSLDFDSVTIYIPLASAQELRELPEGASGFMIKLRDERRAAPVVADIRKLLDARGLRTVSVGTWADLQAGPLAAFEAERLAMNLVLMLFLAVSAFSVTAIFWMMVLAKQRDIGVVRALGASVRSTALVFIVYGALVGVVAGGVGFVAGHGMVAHWEGFRAVTEGGLAKVNIHVDLELFDPSRYYLEGSPMDVDLGRDLLVYAVTIVLCAAAGILPSWRAARTDVIENIKG